MRKRDTHTHTHANAHTHTHTHTRTHTHTNTHTHIHIHAHTHTHTLRWPCMLVCTSVCVYVLLCVCLSLGLLSRTSYMSVFLCVLCAWLWLSTVCYVHDYGYHCSQTFSIYLGVWGGVQLHEERVRGAATRRHC